MINEMHADLNITEACDTRINASRWLYGFILVVLAFLVWQVDNSRKAAERYQQQVNKQVELLSAAVEPTIAVDKNLVIKIASDSARTLFSYRRGELVGTNLADHMLSPMPEAAKELFGSFQAEGRLPRPIEWTMKDKHGDTVCVRMTAEDHLFARSREIFGLKLKVLDKPE